MITRRALTIIIATLLVLGFAQGAATAGPVRSLCSYDPARGEVPSDFGLQACVDGQGIWLRNDLSVPVTVRASGDVGDRANVEVDQTVAAILTRKLHGDSNVMMPNDLVRFPLGSGSAEVTLVDTAAGGKYILVTTLTKFLPTGASVAVYDALTQLVVDWDNAARSWMQCRQGKNVLQQTACDLRAAASMTYSLGKAIGMGLGRGALALVLNTADWGNTILKQAPDIGTIVHGARTLSQGARLAVPTTNAPIPPPAQAQAPAPPVIEAPAPAPPSTEASPTPPLTAEPPPAPPVTQAPPPTPAAPGFTIEDVFYGGTWARTDPDDNFWHGRDDPPTNAAYWYPNGLGVAVECATPAAGYSVSFDDGRPTTTWWWWARVTDGKYVPVATLQGTSENGPQGLPTC